MPESPELRGILIDADGVLYDADRSIAGAADTGPMFPNAPHIYL